MLGAFRWLLLVLPLASARSEFFVPGPPPYPRWKAGDVQKIRYRTTFTEYTIALWQQLDNAGNLGPILFQTTNGPDNEFDWVVQSYSLDLDISDKFFLWLFEGSPSAQGNTSNSQQSSGFFYISEEDTTTTTTTTTSSTSSTSSTTSSTSSTSSETSSSLTTTGDNSRSTNSGDAQNSDSAGGSDLSTGAKAGIGAGAAVAGLAILAAIWLLLKYRSKKKQLAELQGTDYAGSNVGPAFANEPKPTPSYMNAPQQPVSELGTYDHRPRAELG